jgi:hypothetical protein
MDKLKKFNLKSNTVLHASLNHALNSLTVSVADPGNLSRIPDPDPRSRSQIQGQKDSVSQIWIRIKEFKYF